MNEINKTISRAKNAQVEQIYGNFLKQEMSPNLFEKAAEEIDIEKSDIMYSLTGNENNIKVVKTGEEIKEQVDTVLMPRLTSDLAAEENKANEKLKECGAAPTTCLTDWMGSGFEIENLPKVYNWNETYFSNNNSGEITSSLSASDAKDKKVNIPENEYQAECRREYNKIAELIYKIKVDIKACDILKTLQDDKEFELTPRQVVSLKF